jgi:hypothetical protein
MSPGVSIGSRAGIATVGTLAGAPQKGSGGYILRFRRVREFATFHRGTFRARGNFDPGGTKKERLRMPSPLRILPDSPAPGADFARPAGAPNRSNEHVIAPSRADHASIDQDLERLVSSVQWVKRACVVLALEAGQGSRDRRPRLPRASQLPPVPGIGPVNLEGATTGQRRVASSLELAPPLACDRLPLPARRSGHRNNLRGAFFMLIAVAVAGSIAYRISAGGFPSAAEPAQAAQFQAHQPEFR